MTFQLDKSCTAVTDEPLSIQNLEVLRRTSTEAVASVGFSFQYNAENKNFDIFSSVQQQGHSLRHTRVTDCKVGEVVTFTLSADSAKRLLRATLTKKDGTVRTSGAAQSLPAAQVRLKGNGPVAHAPSGAKATVHTKRYAVTGKPIVPPAVKAPSAAAKK